MKFTLLTLFTLDVFKNLRQKYKIMQYRYTLDKSSKKHICPQCKEKRFVLYLDTTINKPLNEYVGRCDKENSCGYHYPPKDYFRDYPQAKHESNFTAHVVVNPQPKNVAPGLTEKMTLLTYSYVEKSQNRTETNHFISFLLTLFSFDRVKEAVKAYCIGTSTKWNGSTIFWQIDENKQVRTGKVLPYNPKTGKRRKYENVPLIDFVHTIMISKDIIKSYSLKQCLFGLHLVPQNPHKIIAAVESEKTAVIMSLILPNYLWLSFGGLNNILQLNTPILQDRKIVVFPDAGTYDRLQPKITELQTLGFNISMSNLIENKATETEKKQGYDLADYAIINEWHKQETDFMQIVERNAMVNILAYLFSCKIL